MEGEEKRRARDKRQGGYKNTTNKKVDAGNDGERGRGKHGKK